jgi:flap endonuclease-1
MPSKISAQFVGNLSKIREAFLKPSVTDNYQIEQGSIDEGGLVEFLCEERDFSKTKVMKTIEKIRKVCRQGHPSILRWSLG